MDIILQQIADWLKAFLVDGIMDNLTGLFDAVNRQVGDVAGEVGTSPLDFSPGVFSMIRSVSESVIVDFTVPHQRWKDPRFAIFLSRTQLLRFRSSFL